jgi:hypothetical protein
MIKKKENLNYLFMTEKEKDYDVMDCPQLMFKDLSKKSFLEQRVILNKEKFIQILDEINDTIDLFIFRNKINNLKEIINYPKKDRDGILNIEVNGDTISLRKDILISELNQILESHTIERAKYYLTRLKKGVQKIKTSKINDINLLRWKEYDEIITDSLWILDKRDTSGAHLGWYWGNFIPQIPHQMILRYTKKGNGFLTPFLVVEQL